jgi:plastocyanin
MTARFLPGAFLLLCTQPILASQVHDVAVVDHSFSPQHLTITEGDSVRWTNQGTHPHNVVANDGSFRCAEGCDQTGSGSLGVPFSYHSPGNSPGDPSATNWAVTLTFSNAGEIGYFCETHGSPGVGMWGSITVESGDEDPPDEPGFEINHGMAGSWYNPETDGQGFLFDFILAFETPLLAIYWFTYDLEPGGPSGQRWMFVEGHYEHGDSSVDLDVYQVTGGVFDDPAEVGAELIGTAHLQFHDCISGELNYELVFDGDDNNPVTGTIPLQALSPDIEQRCEALMD